MSVVGDLRARLETEVSTRKLARALGVHSNTALSYKHGITEPTLSRGLRMARWLGVDPVHLAMFYDEERRRRAPKGS